MDSTPWIPDSLSVELGFRISIINGVPNSLSHDSRVQIFQDFGVHKQNFPGFWNPGGGGEGVRILLVIFNQKNQGNLI